MEAELYSLSMATYDIIYLHNLLSELQIPSLTPARVFVDNTAVIQFSQGSSHQTRSKHFNMPFHYVKEVQTSVIEIFHFRICLRRSIFVYLLDASVIKLHNPSALAFLLTGSS
uniref:Reverse transcriptase Ty1/copia-type domain-containing protein n=1 Tax=Guillardia theta TaxID=55529 RepID=A0A6U5ZED6_GUITH|mmetsp:Transcript_25562/g.84456  ORF Transcript_25562/g.84456 Transcript_25562/m.84456 type:complete len:113 (+) Transcript_25562:1556-1894(+)